MGKRKAKNSQHPERVTELVSEVGCTENATDTSQYQGSQPEIDDLGAPVSNVLGMMGDEQPSTRTRVKPRTYDGTTTWREYYGHFQ